MAYAQLGFADDRLVPRSLEEALRSSLVPGTRVERYGRRWFIAQWEDAGDEWILGRLAFESLSDESGIWDEDKKDVRLVESLGMAVQVVPYAIDSISRRVAFELRSQTVRPGTFQGNFQALLVTASNLPWRVTLEGVKQLPWEEWRRTRVDRITAIWLTLTPPNPHSPIRELEELFEHGVRSAQIVARGEDVELEGADLLEAAFAHASEHGKISAEGTAVVADAPRKEQWKSEEEGAVRKDEVSRPEGTPLAPGALKQLLERRRRDDAGEQSEEDPNGGSES